MERKSILLYHEKQVHHEHFVQPVLVDARTPPPPPPMPAYALARDSVAADSPATKHPP